LMLHMYNQSVQPMLTIWRSIGCHAAQFLMLL
jgi:hypothetical protein